MSGTDTRAPSGSRRKQDVDDLLADLNIDVKPASINSTPSRSAHISRTQGSATQRPPVEAQSVLDDLEGMVQRRRYSPSPRAPSGPSMPRISPSVASAAAGTLPVSPEVPRESAPKLASPAPVSPAKRDTETAKVTETKEAAPEAAQGTGWGQWSSLLSSATRIAGQARHELERRAAEIRGEDAQAELSLQQLSERLSKGVRGIVNDANLGKFGQDISAAGRRGWNDILNVVAPPMEAHEMVQVSLSYDVDGIDGVEGIAFRVLMRVLQQVDIHDVTVVRATAAQKTDADTDSKYKLAAAPSRAEGFAAARANIDTLLKTVAVDASGEQAAAACPLIVRIQAFYEEIVAGADGSDWVLGTAPGGERRHVVFLVWLVDPLHRLSHHTTSQAIPAWWLSHSESWVEQSIRDAINSALGVVSQEYVQARVTTFTQAHGGSAADNKASA
ncbi:hypothetical protein MCUN1_001083 [Malassezia cuniculi]|uniref:Maintenance of telomere capping protein 1 n=1 Tax=Malassezia cuniculi TaxID=948313 RepID=A0AAF0JAF2_9BASI|nr:hypothetical protein MCUN1_001083 [Malassezia cuniculi]